LLQTFINVGEMLTTIDNWLLRVSRPICELKVLRIM